MKIKSLIILLFIISFSKTNAQKFELGKVTIAELEEKECPKDPSADAAILFSVGEVRFVFNKNEGFVMVNTVKSKIKIYKKGGYEWANKAVRYYLGTNINESVSFDDAITYNLVDGKIEKTKLKSDGVFDEKGNRYWGRKKIAMPNVKEGSIIEFEYVLRSNSIGNIRDWDFQTSIPVNHSEYTTYVPEYYVYNTNTKGYIFPKVTVVKSQKSQKFSDIQRNDGNFVARQTSSYVQSELNYEETKTNYVADNLPALKEEAYVNNVNNYTASVVQELSIIKYPNQPLKTYSTDWKSVVKTIYDYDDFGLELKKSGYFEEDINPLIKELVTNEEKISVIFNYVKSSVKWNELYNYSCDDGVKKAYKDKTGNVAEINLMLIAMLRFAGLNANPVLVSTRDNGIALFPSRTAFNYVIAAIETPEGNILLDATEKYSLPNVLPLRDLNWIGRLIRKDGTSTEVDLMPKELSKVVSNVNIVLNSDGSADGKIRRQFTNHKALEFRQENILTAKDTYREELENQNNNIEINDYARENDLDLSKPIIENFSFKDNKDIEIINDKIYISPMLFLATKENPLKQEVRESPIDFGFPVQNKYNINIEIPKGYAVESLPAAINIATGENMGSFKFLAANADNKIQIVITKETNAPIVSADFYADLKVFYQQMIDKQNEKIVLKKI
ncbi:transglutaminase domain-containing protein [Flavobacterium soyangense]|uniref:DUF3857 domain-containing protein n=1 Tax=Flavobacterium soyangense TaxID=2023265 RepID=A0A930UCN1_9FLAO|nr:transglutaminase domain-containing protein [Flavobacterium soyangense]MBF2707965.1 DUF3857 domain-containing protein [Flavobacterium soyangense]